MTTSPIELTNIPYKVAGYAISSLATGIAPINAAVSCGVDCIISALYGETPKPSRNFPLNEAEQTSLSEEDLNNFYQDYSLIAMSIPIQILASFTVLNTLGIQASLINSLSLLATATTSQKILTTAITPAIEGRDIAAIAKEVADLAKRWIFPITLLCSASYLFGGSLTVPQAYTFSNTFSLIGIFLNSIAATTCILLSIKQREATNQID